MLKTYLTQIPRHRHWLVTLLASSLMTACFNFKSEPVSEPVEPPRCSWRDSLTVQGLLDPFDYVQQNYLSGTSMGGASATSEPFDSNKLWLDPALTHDAGSLRVYDSEVRGSRSSNSISSSGEELVAWYSPRKNGPLPDDLIGDEIALEIFNNRTEDLGLDPLNEQDMNDLAFLFYAPRLGFAQYRKSDSNFSAFDGAHEQLEVWIFGVNAEDIEEGLSVPILDASALSAPRRADDEESLAPIYRQLIDEQRKRGGPFAVAAYCAFSHALSCMESRSVEFAAGGNVDLSEPQTWKREDEADKVTVDAEVNVKLGDFASLKSESTCLSWPDPSD